MGIFRKDPKAAARKALARAKRRLGKAVRAEKAAIARLDACIARIGRSRGELLMGVRLKDLRLVLRSAVSIREHEAKLPGLKAAREKAGAAVALLRKELDALPGKSGTIRAEGLS